MGRMRSALLACAACSLTSCFDPRLPAVACGPGGSCPPGQRCDTTDNVCEAADSVDGSPATDARPCEALSGRFVDGCALPAPSGGLDLSTADLPGSVWTIDTETGVLLDPESAPLPVASALLELPGGERIRALSVASFSVGRGAVLRGTGVHPLVIASWSTAHIEGTLDVASTRLGADQAAGGEPGECAEHAAQGGGMDDASGANGGGGGGGFGSAGGLGAGAIEVRAQGGSKVPLPAVLRGGCTGGDGAGLPASPGGSGGGAVAIIALDRITLSGVIHAGGAGGQGAATTSAAGGGGGSGGMIALESDSITLVAGGVLAANGGGGGQGGQSDGVAPFESGEDASAGTRNASGGGSAGSIGGDGAALAPGTGQDGTLAVLNGGGGGGGVGFVVLFVDNLDNAGVISSPLVGAFPRVSSP